jgi:hypothetical protein
MSGRRIITDAFSLSVEINETIVFDNIQEKKS